MTSNYNLKVYHNIFLKYKKLKYKKIKHKKFSIFRVKIKVNKILW